MTRRTHTTVLFRASALLILGVVGCSHGVDSPAVSVESVEPELICRTQRAQADLVVTVKGSGFAAQPVNVLAGKQKLLVPTVLLDKTLELSGAKAGDAGDRLFPGDPDEDLSENLEWLSDTKLRFHVTEEGAFHNAQQVNLAPGIYDVTVTNPDEKHAATLAQALAVVDPPSISAVAPVPPALCVEQDVRVLEITGDNFATVEGAVPSVRLAALGGGTTTTIEGDAVVAEDCDDAPGSFAGPAFALCRKLKVTLPRDNALPAGAYAVSVTSPPPADCTSSEMVEVLIVAPPSVATLAPTATCVADGARDIAVTGDSFARLSAAGPTVTLTDDAGMTTTADAKVGACMPQMTPATDFMTDLCTTLGFSVASSVVPGKYAVSVTNPDPVGCTSSEAFDLLVVARPTLTEVEPPSACLDGKKPKLTLTGTFATVGGDDPVITVTDADGADTDYAPDTVSGCGDPIGMAADAPIRECTTMEVTLPAAIAQGVYAVRVTNPAPIDCTTSKSVDVVFVPVPTVTEAIPDAVCVDGTSQEVTVVGEFFARVGDALPIVTLTDGDGDATDIVADAVSSCGDVLGEIDGAKVRLCKKATITIPEDATLGDYVVTVTNPAPIDCGSVTNAPLVVTAPPTVTSVTPMQVCSGGSELTVTGTGFRTGATVTVLCDSGGTTHVVDSLASEANEDGTELNLRFGFGAIPGETCDVIVSNAMDCDSKPPHPQIAAVEGPILFYAAPPVAYNGIHTQIKLFMTAVTGTPVVRIVPSGEISGGITLDSMVDPGNARRVLAVVPKDTAAGTYDVLVGDDTDCAATLAEGLVVTDDTSIKLDKVVQPFGLRTEDTAVSLLRVAGDAADNVPFSPTPTAFLNPTGSSTDPAVQLVGVTFVDDVTLTAVVPTDIALGDYDLVVVNPDGSVGVKKDAYSAIDVSPPTIENVFPQSIVNSDQYDAPAGGKVDQELTVFGDNFDTVTVSLVCESPDGMSVAPASVGTGTEACDVNGCTITVDVDGTGLSPGDVCLVRVTNGDGSYADYSAVGVTNSSRNLSDPVEGEPLNTARRACMSSAVRATSAARFVYAIGGDGGPTVADAPFDSVEFAPVGVFGGMKPFVDNPEPLNQARAFAGAETVGRYMYVFGGTDGTDALSSAERALVLSPAEVPVITDIDLCLSGGVADCFGVVPSTDGLLTGEYAYRVSAVIDPTSVHNLGGETLASDPIIIRLPEIVAAGETRKVAVQLFWDAPVDKLDVELEDITGYRIYRTPADGVAASDELLIGEVDETTFDFIDGGIDPGTDQPLPQGSTSAWQVLPSLGTARNAFASAVARDPDSATGYFLYALLGMDSGDTDALAGTALTTFEYLNVNVLPNDRQDVVGTWTTGSDTTSLTGRFLHGAWVADQQVFSPLAPGQSWIFVGGGRDGPANGDVLGSMEDLEVQADGDLVYNANNPVQASDPSRPGFATMAAFGRLFVLGGAQPNPRSDASSARIVSVDEVSTSFNSEGVQLVENRYVPGRSIQSAFLFLVGGQTTITKGAGGEITDGAVTDSTEFIVW